MASDYQSESIFEASLVYQILFCMMTLDVIKRHMFVTNCDKPTITLEFGPGAGPKRRSDLDPNCLTL